MIWRSADPPSVPPGDDPHGNRSASGLPTPLEPWAALLQGFPIEAAVALAPMLQRLAAAIGPQRVSSRHGTGALDGYDGIDRRGSYERLLLSEWLLAEEAPEEFDRRAAMGEHAFLRPSRREPAGRKTCVALIDVGPSQIGTPRVLHLAALLVLARRAEAIGARLCFGAVQRPDTPLVRELTATTLRRFLRDGSALEPTAADLDAWRDSLAKAGISGETWVIGGDRLAALPSARPLSMLVVRDPLELEARQLEVSIREGGRERMEIRLEVPPDAVCLKLLREPTGPQTSVTHRVAGRGLRVIGRWLKPASNLVFSGDGRKVYARNAQGHLLAFFPPASPFDAYAPPRWYQDVRGIVVAAGYVHNATCWVEARDGAFFLRLADQPSSRGWQGMEHWIADTLTPEAALQPCFLVPDSQRFHRRLRFLAPTSPTVAMFLVHARDGLSVLQDEQIRALAADTQRHLSYVEYVPGTGHATLSYTTRTGEARVQDLIEHTSQGLKAFFGYGGYQGGESGYGLLAVQRPDGSWSIFEKEGEHVVPKPAGRVIGVTTAGRKKSSPALVCIDAGDARRLVLHDAQGSDTVLVTASSRIEEATCCSSDALLAWSTEAGEMVIQNMWDGEVLYHVVAIGRDPRGRR